MFGVDPRREELRHAGESPVTEEDPGDRRIRHPSSLRQRYSACTDRAVSEDTPAAGSVGGECTQATTRIALNASDLQEGSLVAVAGG